MDHRDAERPPLGFIGLGVIGGAVAGRFADSGRDITVYDVNPAAVVTVMSRGAKAGSSARDVGDRAEVVFCCLPAPEISVAVAEQLRASAACRALVEMSTVGRPTGRFGERADFTNIVRMFEEWAGLGENGLPRR